MRSSVLSAVLAVSTIMTPFVASANTRSSDQAAFGQAVAAQAKIHLLDASALSALRADKKTEAKKRVEVTLTGAVSSMSGSDLVLKVGGSLFTIHTNADTKFLRRFGADMTMADIQVNDQLMVQGNVNAEKDVTATHIRDLSLQARRGTFNGSIASVSSDGLSFVMKSNQRGTQTIVLNKDTKILKNGETASTSVLVAGADVTVNGVWNRTNENVTAEKVNVRVPLARIHVQGTVTAKGENTLTVLTSDQKTYTVDLKGAALVFGQYLRMNKKFISVGDQVDVWARGEAGSMIIKAYFIRNLSQMSSMLRVIQLRDNGTAVGVEVGDRLKLNLGSDYVWTNASSSNATVLPAISGESMSFKAASVGQADVAVHGEPVCRSATPACEKPSVEFRVTVKVDAQAQ